MFLCDRDCLWMHWYVLAMNANHVWWKKKKKLKWVQVDFLLRDSESQLFPVSDFLQNKTLKRLWAALFVSAALRIRASSFHRRQRRECLRGSHGLVSSERGERPLSRWWPAWPAPQPSGWWTGWTWAGSAPGRPASSPAGSDRAAATHRITKSFTSAIHGLLGAKKKKRKAFAKLVR